MLRRSFTIDVGNESEHHLRLRPYQQADIRTLPNAVVSNCEYDGLNRSKHLTHAKGANTLADFQYQFNDVNNITLMIDNAGTDNYSYDPLDRLIDSPGEPITLKPCVFPCRGVPKNPFTR